MTDPTSTSEAILQAAEQLYARGESGFSHSDAVVVSAILRADRKQPKQILSLWGILKPYKETLSTLGIEYGALVPPKPSEKESFSRPTKSPKNTISLKAVVTKNGQMVAVNVPYEERLVNLIRGLKNRRWDDDGKLSGTPKTWLIPAKPLDIELAIATFKAEKDLFLEIDPVLIGLVEKGKQSYQESRSDKADLKIPTKIELYPFQKAGVKWIDDHNGRAFVADDMGVGKSAQALGYFVLRPEKALPALIICPALVRVSWYREVFKFTNLRPLLISGKTSLPFLQKAGFQVSDRPLPGYDVTITNYDLLTVETPNVWLKQLLGKKKEAEKYAEVHLAWAGNQAVELLGKAMLKHTDIESRNRINRVLGIIKLQGDKARKVRDPEYKVVYINNIPFDEFVKAGYQTLVCDESHFAKDGNAQRTMGALDISSVVRNAICLTGTPIDNRPKELWTQTQIVDRSVFPTFFDYGKRYCAGYQKDAGRRMVWDFNGASNIDELEKALRSTIMIRRTKEQVLKELPPKTRTLIPFIVDESLDKEYRKVEAPALDRLRQLRQERKDWKTLFDAMPPEDRKGYAAKHAEKAIQASRLSDLAISEIEKLKEAAVNAKLAETISFTVGLHETQGKILVFAVHHKTIDRLLQAFREKGIKTDTIDGRVTGEARQQKIDAFQGGDLEILVCGIRAASIGLTLTASHTVVFIELDWTPGAHSQAEDRTYRIGQSKPVTVYYLLLLGSIEEKIAKMIDSKRAIVNAAMGEGEKTIEEGGILDALLDEILA